MSYRREKYKIVMRKQEAGSELLLFRNYTEAKAYCKEQGLDIKEIEHLPNGFMRIRRGHESSSKEGNTSSDNS